MQTRIFHVVLSLAAAVALQACLAGKQLPTGPARPSGVRGSYTLLLYGCHYPEDIKDVAFLIPEGSRYTFEIYDLATSFKTEAAVPADQALAKADSFVRCSSRKVSQSLLRRIVDDSGATVGYEVRPLYFPLEFGRLDVLLVSYALQDGTIRAYIKLDPDVEKAIESSGSDRDRSDR
jgi:hypothetical protein